jgi:casein kinase 1 delta/casein kinase I family protein HRR25
VWLIERYETGYDILNNKQVAIKFTGERQDADDESQSLIGEAEICKAVGDKPSARGMPKFLWVGLADDYSALVTELLGPSLTDLLFYCGDTFSLKTVLMLADQAILRLAWIHKQGYLHRDVKPSNFVMGIGNSGKVLYAIDMGMGKSWEQAKFSRENQHHRRGFCGTQDYASMNAHLGTGSSFNSRNSWCEDS